MPKKRRKAATSDHLSAALEALRERPRPDVGLQSEDRIAPLSYVAGVDAGSKNGAAGASRRRRGGKLRIAFNLPEELCERARNAVWHLAGRIRVNLSTLTQGALEREVARLERKYNAGKPFARRKGRLRGGPLPVTKRRAGQAGGRTKGD